MASFGIVNIERKPVTGLVQSSGYFQAKCFVFPFELFKFPCPLMLCALQTCNTKKSYIFFINLWIFLGQEYHLNVP